MNTEQMEGSTVVYVVEQHTWIHHLRPNHLLIQL